jgi:hypothetical protein
MDAGLVAIAVFLAAACPRAAAPSNAPRAPEAVRDSSGAPADGGAIPEVEPSGDAQGCEAAAASLPAAATAQAPDETAASNLELSRRSGHPLSDGGPGWHALAAEAATPAWGRSGGTTSAARDDDLKTAWTCESAAEDGPPCALLLAFPERARVRLIRVFASLGTWYEERGRFARVKTVRVHTGRGWMEASLEDRWSYQYLLLNEEVETDGITLEVVDTYPGSDSAAVGFAEVEVFGPAGRAREPLDLDPRRAVIQPGRSRPPAGVEVPSGPGDRPVLFSSDYEEETRAQVLSPWLEVIDAAGGSRRILDATALLGEPGDRYLLAERLSRMGCSYEYEVAAAEYTVIDRETRAFLDVGETDTADGPVFRHRDGNGFAIAPGPSVVIEPESAVLRTVVVEDDRVVRGEQPLDESRDTDLAWITETAAGLGFDHPLRSRGMGPACRAATRQEATDLLADPALVPRSYLPAHDGWGLCDLPASRRLLVLSETCERAYGFLLGPDGRPCGAPLRGFSGTIAPDPTRIGDHPAEGLRVRVLDTGEALIETYDDGIYVVGRDGEPRLPYPNARFDLNRAPACSCFCCGGDDLERTPDQE